MSTLTAYFAGGTSQVSTSVMLHLCDQFFCHFQVSAPLISVNLTCHPLHIDKTHWVQSKEI